MNPSLPRRLMTATLAAILLLGATSCGKKGPPRPPEATKSEYTYPEQYPAPETVVPNGGTTSTDGTPLSIFRDDDRSKTKTY